MEYIHQIEQPKLDQQWFERLRRAIPQPVYEYFDHPREIADVQKHLFFIGEIRNPNFGSIHLDPRELAQRATLLYQLKYDILSTESNPIVLSTYTDRINTEFANLDLLDASLHGNMDKFAKASNLIYGEPSADIFVHDLDQLHRYIDLISQTTSDELQLEVATYLKSILPPVLANDQNLQNSIYIPNIETFEYAKTYNTNEFADIIKLNVPMNVYKSTDIQSEFQSALTKLSLTDWTVTIDSDSSKINLSINPKTKTVHIPIQRELAPDSLQKLIIHELGTHALRRDNGVHSKLMLLGLGLDGYEQGEEGIATMREQILDNKFAPVRSDLHLAIGLARGLDGIPRDFRDVYEILHNLYLLQNLETGMEYSNAKHDAADDAWHKCMRVFRGTDFKTPGVCFTKDIIYTKGNQDIWRVIHNTPNEIRRFSVGKYDPSNPHHIWVLDQLGITDADLANLSS